MNLVIRIILSLIFILSQNACVGGIVGYDQVKNFIHPQIHSEKGVLLENHSSFKITKNDLLKKWGPPSHTKKINPKTELLTYNLDKRFYRGVVIFIPIPIPLVIPYGSNYVNFKIKDGYIVDAQTRLTKTIGGVCGLIPYGKTAGLKFGCTGM